MNAERDAALVAALFAVDPAGVGGVCLRSLAYPVRDQWLQMLRDLLPQNVPMRRIPFNIADERLLGGLDLAASLAANRPIGERGVLAAADGGVVVISMAERLTAHTVGCLNGVLDAGEVTVPRIGTSVPQPARVGIVAIDEGMSEDECVPLALLDRVAFVLDLHGFHARSVLLPQHDEADIVTARRLLPHVRAGTELLKALCATALALGAGSPRISWLALRVARSAAALHGRTEIIEEDAVLAGRLVLAPRATAVPTEESQSSPAEAPEDSRNELRESDEPQAKNNTSEDLDDIVLAAARAAIPSGMLARLRSGTATRQRAAGIGRVGATRSGGFRGRPSGVRSGAPKDHGRLNLIETLRAAAPWQRLRGRENNGDFRLRFKSVDYRFTRYRQRTSTLTIFAVDASGSSALNRLAEAKGAVELLLADCYIRRDHVAVIAFRGRSAELLLPRTRSLVRAKRSLAGLPGGGGTPLAAAIDSAVLLANQAQRRGETPTLVMLTDGRANVARDGGVGRERAQAEALDAARAVRLSKVAALFIDTSPRPTPQSKDLAAAMHAQYIALPHASARGLSGVIKAQTERSAR